MPRKVSKKAHTVRSSQHSISVLAVISFVFGLLFLTPLIGGIFGLIAIFIGVMALMKINQYHLRGRWFAILGIALGSIGLIGMLSLLGIIALFSH